MNKRRWLITGIVAALVSSVIGSLFLLTSCETTAYADASITLSRSVVNMDIDVEQLLSTTKPASFTTTVTVTANKMPAGISSRPTVKSLNENIVYVGAEDVTTVGTKTTIKITAVNSGKDAKIKVMSAGGNFVKYITVNVNVAAKDFLLRERDFAVQKPISGVTRLPLVMDDIFTFTSTKKTTPSGALSPSYAAFNWNANVYDLNYEFVDGEQSMLQRGFSIDQKAQELRVNSNADENVKFVKIRAKLKNDPTVTREFKIWVLDPFAETIKLTPYKYSTPPIGVPDDPWVAKLVLHTPSIYTDKNYNREIDYGVDINNGRTGLAYDNVGVTVTYNAANRVYVRDDMLQETLEPVIGGRRDIVKNFRLSAAVQTEGIVPEVEVVVFPYVNDPETGRTIYFKYEYQKAVQKRQSIKTVVYNVFERDKRLYADGQVEKNSSVAVVTDAWGLPKAKPLNVFYAPNNYDNRTKFELKHQTPTAILNHATYFPTNANVTFELSTIAGATLTKYGTGNIWDYFYIMAGPSQIDGYSDPFGNGTPIIAPSGVSTAFSIILTAEALLNVQNLVLVVRAVDQKYWPANWADGVGASNKFPIGIIELNLMRDVKDILVHKDQTAQTIDKLYPVRKTEASGGYGYDFYLSAISYGALKNADGTPLMTTPTNGTDPKQVMGYGGSYISTLLDEKLKPIRTDGVDVLGTGVPLSPLERERGFSFEWEDPSHDKLFRVSTPTVVSGTTGLVRFTIFADKVDNISPDIRYVLNIKYANGTKTQVIVVPLVSVETIDKMDVIRVEDAFEYQAGRLISTSTGGDNFISQMVLRLNGVYSFDIFRTPMSTDVWTTIVDTGVYSTWYALYSYQEYINGETITRTDTGAFRPIKEGEYTLTVRFNAENNYALPDTLFNKVSGVSINKTINVIVVNSLSKIEQSDNYIDVYSRETLAQESPDNENPKSFCDVTLNLEYTKGVTSKWAANIVDPVLAGDAANYLRILGNWRLGDTFVDPDTTLPVPYESGILVRIQGLKSTLPTKNNTTIDEQCQIVRVEIAQRLATWNTGLGQWISDVDTNGDGYKTVDDDIIVIGTIAQIDIKIRVLDANLSQYIEMRGVGATTYSIDLNKTGKDAYGNDYEKQQHELSPQLAYTAIQSDDTYYDVGINYRLEAYEIVTGSSNLIFVDTASTARNAQIKLSDVKTLGMGETDGVIVSVDKKGTITSGEKSNARLLDIKIFLVIYSRDSMRIAKTADPIQIGYKNVTPFNNTTRAYAPLVAATATNGAIGMGWNLYASVYRTLELNIYDPSNFTFMIDSREKFLELLYEPEGYTEMIDGLGLFVGYRGADFTNMLDNDLQNRANGWYFIVADIDLSGLRLTPIRAFKGALIGLSQFTIEKGFSGFQYSINNFRIAENSAITTAVQTTVNYGLFETLYGRVENLIFDNVVVDIKKCSCSPTVISHFQAGCTTPNCTLVHTVPCQINHTNRGHDTSGVAVVPSVKQTINLGIIAAQLQPLSTDSGIIRNVSVKIKTGKYILRGFEAINFGGLTGINRGIIWETTRLNVSGSVTIDMSNGVESNLNSNVYRINIGGLAGINFRGAYNDGIANGTYTGTIQNTLTPIKNASDEVLINSELIIALVGNTTQDNFAGAGFERNLGGAVGYNYGAINNIASENMLLNTTRGNTGGLVGRNAANGTIENCYCTSSMFARGVIGGLVGYNQGTIFNSHYDFYKNRKVEQGIINDGFITALDEYGVPADQAFYSGIAVLGGKLVGGELVGGASNASNQYGTGVVNDDAADGFNALAQYPTIIGGLVGVNFNEIRDCVASSAFIEYDNVSQQIPATNKVGTLPYKGDIFIRDAINIVIGGAVGYYRSGVVAGTYSQLILGVENNTGYINNGSILYGGFTGILGNYNNATLSTAYSGDYFSMIYVNNNNNEITRALPKVGLNRTTGGTNTALEAQITELFANLTAIASKWYTRNLIKPEHISLEFRSSYKQIYGASENDRGGMNYVIPEIKNDERRSANEARILNNSNSMNPYIPFDPYQHMEAAALLYTDGVQRPGNITANRYYLDDIFEKLTLKDPNALTIIESGTSSTGYEHLDGSEGVYGYGLVTSVSPSNASERVKFTIEGDTEGCDPTCATLLPDYVGGRIRWYIKLEKKAGAFELWARSTRAVSVKDEDAAAKIRFEITSTVRTLDVETDAGYSQIGKLSLRASETRPIIPGFVVKKTGTFSVKATVGGAGDNRWAVAQTRTAVFSDAYEQDLDPTVLNISYMYPHGGLDNIKFHFAAQFKSGVFRYESPDLAVDTVAYYNKGAKILTVDQDYNLLDGTSSAVFAGELITDADNIVDPNTLTPIAAKFTDLVSFTYRGEGDMVEHNGQMGAGVPLFATVADLVQTPTPPSYSGSTIAVTRFVPAHVASISAFEYEFFLEAWEDTTYNVDHSLGTERRFEYIVKLKLNRVVSENVYKYAQGDADGIYNDDTANMFKRFTAGKLTVAEKVTRAFSYAAGTHNRFVPISRDCDVEIIPQGVNTVNFEHFAETNIERFGNIDKIVAITNYTLNAGGNQIGQPQDFSVYADTIGRVTSGGLLSIVVGPTNANIGNIQLSSSIITLANGLSYKLVFTQLVRDINQHRVNPAVTTSPYRNDVYRNFIVGGLGTGAGRIVPVSTSNGASGAGGYDFDGHLYFATTIEGGNGAISPELLGLKFDIYLQMDIWDSGTNAYRTVGSADPNNQIVEHGKGLTIRQREGAYFNYENSNNSGIQAIGTSTQFYTYVTNPDKVTDLVLKVVKIQGITNANADGTPKKKPDGTPDKDGEIRIYDNGGQEAYGYFESPTSNTALLDGAGGTRAYNLDKIKPDDTRPADVTDPNIKNFYRMDLRVERYNSGLLAEVEDVFHNTAPNGLLTYHSPADLLGAKIYVELKYKIKDVDGLVQDCKYPQTLAIDITLFKIKDIYLGATSNEGIDNGDTITISTRSSQTISIKFTLYDQSFGTYSSLFNRRNDAVDLLRTKINGTQKNNVNWFGISPNGTEQNIGGINIRTESYEPPPYNDSMKNGLLFAMFESSNARYIRALYSVNQTGSKLKINFNYDIDNTSVNADLNIYTNATATSLSFTKAFNVRIINSPNVPTDGCPSCQVCPICKALNRPNQINCDVCGLHCDCIEGNERPIMPITSMEGLIRMKPGEKYILMNDIEMINWAPIPFVAAELDGNNKRLVLVDRFNLDGNENYNIAPNPVNIGVFTDVLAGGLIKNLNLVFTERTGTNVENKETADFVVDLSSYPRTITEVNVGTLAGVNHGLITNVGVYSWSQMKATALVSKYQVYLDMESIFETVFDPDFNYTWDDLNAQAQELQRQAEILQSYTGDDKATLQREYDDLMRQWEELKAKLEARDRGIEASLSPESKENKRLEIEVINGKAMAKHFMFDTDNLVIERERLTEFTSSQARLKVSVNNPAIKITVGGLVGRNEEADMTDTKNPKVGVISNSRVLVDVFVSEPYKMAANQDANNVQLAIVSGFVGVNKGTIVSSMFRNASVINNCRALGQGDSGQGGADYGTQTSGFVGQNANKGVVKACYVESTGQVYSFNGYIGGFVYSNLGTALIEDCYININILGGGASRAGFVDTNAGTIQRCFADSPITNFGSGSNPNNPGSVGGGQTYRAYQRNEEGGGGTMENNKYRDYGSWNATPYPTAWDVIDEDGAKDRKNIDNWLGYSVGDGSDGADAKYMLKSRNRETQSGRGEKGAFDGEWRNLISRDNNMWNNIWQMSTRGPRLVSADEVATSIKTINLINSQRSRKPVYDSAKGADENGVEVLNFEDGEWINPIVIDDGLTLNKMVYDKSFKSPFNTWRNDQTQKMDFESIIYQDNIRLINNISLLNADIGKTNIGWLVTAETIYAKGVFDGNGLDIRNISVNTSSATEGLRGRLTSAGMFSQVKYNAVFKNMKLNFVRHSASSPASIVSPGTVYAGGLVGRAENSEIVDIEFYGNLSSVTADIIGGNITGGVIGYAVETRIESVRGGASVRSREGAYSQIRQPICGFTGAPAIKVFDWADDYLYCCNDCYKKYVKGQNNKLYTYNHSNLSIAGGVVGYYEESINNWDSHKTGNTDVVFGDYIKNVCDYNGKSFDVAGEVVGGLFGFLGNGITAKQVYNRSGAGFTTKYYAGGIVGINYGTIDNKDLGRLDFKPAPQQTEYITDTPSMYTISGTISLAPYSVEEGVPNTPYDFLVGSDGYKQNSVRGIRVGGVAGYNAGAIQTVNIRPSVSNTAIMSLGGIAGGANAGSTIRGAVVHKNTALNGGLYTGGLLGEIDPQSYKFTRLLETENNLINNSMVQKTGSGADFANNFVKSGLHEDFVYGEAKMGYLGYKNVIGLTITMRQKITCSLVEKPIYCATNYVTWCDKWKVNSEGEVVYNDCTFDPFCIKAETHRMKLCNGSPECPAADTHNYGVENSHQYGTTWHTKALGANGCAGGDCKHTYDVWKGGKRISAYQNPDVEGEFWDDADFDDDGKVTGINGNQLTCPVYKDTGFSASGEDSYYYVVATTQATGIITSGRNGAKCPGDHSYTFVRYQEQATDENGQVIKDPVLAPDGTPMLNPDGSIRTTDRMIDYMPLVYTMSKAYNNRIDVTTLSSPTGTISPTFHYAPFGSAPGENGVANYPYMFQGLVLVENNGTLTTRANNTAIKYMNPFIGCLRLSTTTSESEDQNVIRPVYYSNMASSRAPSQIIYEK